MEAGHLEKSSRALRVQGARGTATETCQTDRRGSEHRVTQQAERAAGFSRCPAVERAWSHIRAILSGSPVPEDPRHADNTVQWLLRLEPGADEALRLAALAHDIDRAVPPRVRRADFDDYDAFKAAHARRGARLLRGVLGACAVERGIVEEACRLVERHEVGGDPRSDLLRDADSLSYFEVNLPLYLQREGPEESLRRARWGLARLSPDARRHLQGLHHEDPAAEALLRQALAAGPLPTAA